jgi:membrane-bound lytic murein transglycosylase A
LLNSFSSKNYSEEISLKTKIQEISDKDLTQFSLVLKQVCFSGKFFKNLENHASYSKFGNAGEWNQKCLMLKSLSRERELIDFLINNFKLVKIEKKESLLTGYYQPIINVSFKKTNVYKYPILKNNKFYLGKPRGFIEKIYKSDDVILWTDDKIDLFFLHIQGSGIGKLENNEKIRISYDGNNKQQYSSIGKYLIEKKLIHKNNVNLFTIKQWLRKNSDLSRDIMNKNERFIFFKIEFTAPNNNPIGAMGIKLTPYYSIAVDDKIYPLGLPFIIEAVDKSLFLPSVSLDTGSAIVGGNRADLFLGRGKEAEKIAGNLKKKIYLYALIPYSK